VKIDNLYIETMEAVSAAAFLTPQEKIPYMHLATRKVDALKLLLMILWETKSIEAKQYIALSEKMDEVGKMLDGWQGQLAKLDPAQRRGEK